MSAAVHARAQAHTPGQQCDRCEGFCLQGAEHRFDAGVEMSFRIGQRVRHQDYKRQRVTGIVRSLSVDGEQGLMVSIVLDAPIVIPEGHGIPEIKIWNQHAKAHEFSPFDERDELVEELLAVAQRCERRLTAEKWRTEGPREALDPEALLLLDLRATIAKTTGSGA